MHSSVSASGLSVVDILASGFGEPNYKRSVVQLSSACANKPSDFLGALHCKHERDCDQTLGQSEFEPCFTDDEETAFEGSDDGATVYDEDFEQGDDSFAWKWDPCSFPSLLAERLDIPDDQDADLDFYPSLLDERLDFQRDDILEFEEEDECINCDPYIFPSLFDEQLDSFESDTEPDLDFYPSILDELIELPVDDSFEWPAPKIKTIRWADSQGAALVCVGLLTEVEFKGEWDISKYPSLLEEELEIPEDSDFHWAAPIVQEPHNFKVQCKRSNGECWSPNASPSLFDEEPIYDLDRDDEFYLPVTDDIPSLIDEQMDLPDQDWFDNFVGRKI
ncbi:hypothetical protein M407DRAFT_25399 [Tulasnella calospora MUT 4182]|uniref:Uncharacterized protein n=1 Tax=Tulasnella calospora MUT 4182 TaxID=1051891 RepID=A0A0C3Q708_9AGAM|nr:hypothetical protein M407DRAFT_25399 [Tulasnella calospora MUT 4182]